jgi:hypothetical protein
MVEMTRAARVPNMGQEYGNFLYATIGTEANGTSLSVLSAMARMNLDPWREAANLAGLSAKAAAGRLASMIAALPGRPPVEDEPGTIAARLVKLLPQQGVQSPEPAQQSRLSVPPYLNGVMKVLSAKGAIYVVIVLIALTLGVRWFAANQPPAGNAQHAVSETLARPSVPLSH